MQIQSIHVESGLLTVTLVDDWTTHHYTIPLNEINPAITSKTVAEIEDTKILIDLINAMTRLVEVNFMARLATVLERYTTSNES